MIDGARTGGPTAGPSFRPVRATELADCAAIWRASINDYIVHLGQTEIPLEMAPIVRLYTHLQATDPERFIVATLPDGPGDRVIGFAAATVREHLWYLSMLFVLPEFQGSGLGRELLGRVAPTDGAMVRAVATDSAQPISNAMYAGEGMVPRMPLFSLTGLPRRPEAFGELPSGVSPIAFDEIVAGPPGGQGHQMLVEAIDAIDRELLGVAHPADHRFLRTESRHGWLYRGPDGTPIGYGYAGEAGRRRTDRRSGRGAARTGPRPPDRGRRATRRVRAVGRRRCRPRGRDGAPGGLPDGPVPRPAVLGPAVRDLLALPADLAGTALTGRPDRTRTAVRRRGRLPDLRAGGSLGSDVAPSRARRGVMSVVTMRRDRHPTDPRSPS